MDGPRLEHERRGRPGIRLVSSAGFAAALCAILLLASCKPEIARIVPLVSKVEGGGALTIEGKQLDGGEAAVTIGSADAPIEKRTAAQIVARIPPGALGPSQVKVSIGRDFTDARPFAYVIERIVTVARAEEAGFVQRSSLVQRKEALLDAVRPLGVEVISDQPDLPTMVLSIPSAEALAAVETNSNVAGSSAPQRVRPDTVESLPLIHHDWARALPEPQGGPFMGAGTSVLVLDTGLDWRNPFFKCPTLTAPGCRVAAMVEFAGPDGGDEDSTFHGTNVSAIALSVAPGAKVIAGDVLGEGTTSEAIVGAIQWAITNRAKYNIASVNMSFSLPGSETTGICYTHPLAAAVSFARFNGLVMVASTSNDYYKDRLLVPGCGPGVIRVGAVYDDGPDVDRETDFSNAWAWPFMVAPGEYITAAGHHMRGTSQAAPHVAGAAAVMRGAYPDASVEFIMNRLERSGPRVKSKHEGSYPRRLDLYAALVDQMWRPAPLPRHYEWAWTRSATGTHEPLSERPRFEIQPNNRFATDLRTGLTWMRVIPGDPPAVAVDIRKAQAYCRSGFGAGRSYRLPTRAELMTLFDMGAPRGRRLDLGVLGPVAGAPIWTLSPGDRYEEAGELVWAGSEGILTPSVASGIGGAVLCVNPMGLVPAEAPPAHFTDEGATVFDNATGLRWLKATGPQSDYFQAADWCAARSDGGRFWRLPTAKESQSIVGVVKESGVATDSALFGPAEDRITASDFPRPEGATSAYGWWTLSERSGILNETQARGAVRCVQNLDPKASRDGVHVGDVQIDGDTAQERYQRFASSGFKVIRGDLIINSPDLPRVLLQRVERIEGVLDIGHLTSADLIALPNLAEVTGGISIGHGAARRIDLRRLKTVKGDLRITDNPNLGADQPGGTNGDGLDAPILLNQLEKVDGTLEIKGNPQLKAFEFKNLASVGQDIRVTWNERLERFRWSRLDSVGLGCINGTICGILEVGFNNTLGSFTLSAVREIRWGLDVQQNRSLTGFSVAGARMLALYKVIRNDSLCPYLVTDPGLRSSLSKGYIDDIEVSANKPDTVQQRCASRCPDEDRCEYIGSRPARRPVALRPHAPFGREPVRSRVES